MTENTMLTANGNAEPDERPCPTWCAEEPTIHDGYAHFGNRTLLEWPDSPYDPTGPLLEAHLTLLYEHQDEDREPEVWLSTAGNSIELDEAELGRFVVEVERFALGLRSLKREFASQLATKISSGDAVTCDEPIEEPHHPTEITMPCPPWCDYKGTLHSPWPAEDMHFGSETRIGLSLEAPAKFLGSLCGPSLTVALGQYPFADQPSVELGIEAQHQGFCRISLGEARELHHRLGQMINEAARTPDRGSSRRSVSCSLPRMPPSSRTPSWTRTPRATPSARYPRRARPGCSCGSSSRRRSATNTSAPCCPNSSRAPTSRSARPSRRQPLPATGTA